MWDERYAEPGYAYGVEPNQFLQEVAERYLPASGRVLCLAEGEGRNAVFLAERGFDVTAVDSSAVGLDKAQRLANERKVELKTVVADLRDFPLGVGAWDGIVSIWCHLPSKLRADLHARAVEALKPGGVFLLEAYSPEQLRYGTGGPGHVDLLVSLDALLGELRGLETVRAESLVRHVSEGKYHEGPSAVVELIARKPPFADSSRVS